MDLAAALGLGDRELVAFVGAGGKKTAASRLVRDAGQNDRSVAYTTTTNTPPLAELSLVLAAPDDLPAVVADGVAFASHHVAVPERVPEKVRGYDPDTIDRVFRSAAIDWLLVKADGARQREFKAPAGDEPRIPRSATHVVPVASVAVVGEPLDDELVHRPERVARLTGLQRGDPVSAKAVGAVIASPDGGCKGIPDGATVTPIVNKADTPADRTTAREVLATALQLTGKFDRGLVTSFRTSYCAVVTDRS